MSRENARRRADCAEHGVTHEDIAACLQYATEILQSEKVYPAAIA
jgi:uncharacterized protein (DUF433 family)